MPFGMAAMSGVVLRDMFMGLYGQTEAMTLSRAIFGLQQLQPDDEVVRCKVGRLACSMRWPRAITSEGSAEAASADATA